MALARWLLLLFLVTPNAWAQAPTPDTPPIPTASADNVVAGLPAEVREQAAAWVAAWRATPRIVALAAEGEPSEDLTERLEQQLRLLGEKTFSNREWKTYWSQQAETAQALVTAGKAAGAAPEKIAVLERWVALAKSKVENQDRFFEAIETQRDALEDRLEAALDASTDEAERETPEEIEDPNPYERRRMAIEDLERRLEEQRARRATIQSDITFIERELESEGILAEAMDRDLELARTELEIASDAAKSDGAWGTLWTEISANAAAKVDTLTTEVDHGRAHVRSRRVELGLAKSQIAFRDGRIAELDDELAEVSSPSTFFAATWQTVFEWLRSQAWKVLLALIGVYIGVRLALRVLKRAVRLILERTDDNPDVDDDSDQRRQTLADVFSSVARIAIYVVAGLVALEQIGINTGPLMGSVAILGLAISFGSQNLVRDLVNGFFILLENQYAVGDVVTLGGKTGTIEWITIRSTWLRGANGDLHVIPNGSISLVSNQTRGWSRAICDVGVGYGADLAKVREVVERVGAELYDDAEWQYKLTEVPQWVGVTDLGDSAVGVRTQVKVVAGQQWAVVRELNRRLKLAFDAEGIEIPFPQIVVHRTS